jgi:hypothetical protein
MSKPKVFISYLEGQGDKEWVKQFVHELERENLSVWMDKSDIVPGAPIVQELNKALRASDIIVSILNEEAINSPNVFFELGAALAMGKQMVAVVPSDFNLSRLPDPLKQRSFLVKGEPDETAKSVASLATQRPAGELSDSELERITQHIANYLSANNFNSVSFERIRERINPNYSDELLLAVIDKLPQRFRRVRLKGNKPGIGFVKD